jgi:hypothetical protein
MENLLVIRVEMFQDRKGYRTTIWAVYYKDRVINVEFTRGNTPMTERVELQEVA